MERRLAFVTDSTVYYTDQLRENLDLYIVPIERVRAEKKAIGKLITAVKSSYEEKNATRVRIMHGNAQEKDIGMKQRLEEAIPCLHTFIGDISSSLAVHAGEDTIGVSWNER